ncbi:uncharacterized protein [Antedon mediterranea]|uniref:uncharacterized protein n=1 Tax=Antedon mediterranea TaxID=105859 RepID=UPI003AF95744
MPGERRSLRNLFNRRTHRRNQTLDLVPAPPPSQQEIKDEQSFFRRIFGCCFPFVLRRQAPAARAPPPVPPPTPAPSAESGASLATAASPVEEPVDHQFLKTRKPKVRPVVATLNLSLPKSPINMLKESVPAMTLFNSISGCTTSCNGIIRNHW